MKKRLFFFSIIIGLLSLFLVSGPQTLAQSSSEERYLLLDSRIIEEVINANFTLGTVRKHEANPLFGRDEPWAQAWDNAYPAVVYDPQTNLFRIWYNPFIDLANEFTALGYAQSIDGITWVKPNLGLVMWNGNMNNNMIDDGPLHGVGVFLDPHENDPTKRFKMFYREGLEQWDEQNCLAVRYSANGINWSDWQETGCVATAPGDTHNNALWAPTLNKYVAFTRLKDGNGQRLVGRLESADYINWTAPVEVLRGDMSHQTYSMPVFYHAGVYLGLPTILYSNNHTQVELAWSPDTVNWYRIKQGKALIGNSLPYDIGTVFAAPIPLFLQNEIRLYYAGSSSTHDIDGRDSTINLATLRPDGFAGYEPSNVSNLATITAKAILYSGEPLRISADVSPGGYVRAAVVDNPNLNLTNSQPITTNVTDAVMSWQSGNLADLAGQQIAFTFEVYKAKLYSFSFGQGSPVPSPTSGCAGPADIDCDGGADKDDALMVLRNFGQNPSQVTGYHDPVGDSKINGMDFGWVVKDWTRN